jgi:hypothetical protein
VTTLHGLHYNGDIVRVCILLLLAHIVLLRLGHSPVHSPVLLATGILCMRLSRRGVSGHWLPIVVISLRITHRRIAGLIRDSFAKTQGDSNKSCDATL